MTLLLKEPPKAAVKPARKKPEPAEPLTDVIAFDDDTLTGTIVIADEPYYLRGLTNDGELLGWRLIRRKPTGQRKKIDVMVGEGYSTCDCEDATYRPERAHTCKHCRCLAQFGFISPIPEVAHA